MFHAFYILLWRRLHERMMTLRRTMRLAPVIETVGRASGNDQSKGSGAMRASSLFSPVRWIGMVVLLLMAVAVAYAGYTAIIYWPSIAV